MQPIVEELTPFPNAWAVCRRLAHLPGVIFLDSAQEHPTLGRYSYVAAAPFACITSRGRTVRVQSRGEASVVEEDADPFEVLRRQLAEHVAESAPGLPPFQGGAAGLFGYDLCHHVERLPRPARNDFHVPEMCVGLYDWVISFDHVQRRTWLVSTGERRLSLRERAPFSGAKGDTFPLLARDVLDLINGSECDVARAPKSSSHIEPHRAATLPGMPQISSNFTRADYLKAIRKAIEYVHAGDCFQVNVAQRLLTPVTAAPLDLYGRLRERNPAPFAGYFDLGDFVILSASPEWFVNVNDGEVETRPIKGTRRIGSTPAEDEVIRQQLLQSTKDRAENVMIVDLLRNDLGRVCEYGSINVPTVCGLETYRYVHHLVSEVRGRLRADRGPIDLLRAAFPGGSITGAPKVRAMEIIAELEGVSRGAYCGSMGYIGFNGTLGTNLLIRTITHGCGWLQFPVGGGIVADSVPEEEYEETMHKAEGLLRAIET